MTPQVAPDYTRVGLAHALEKEFENFKFKGPGFYLSDSDTTLVVPRVPSQAWAIKGWENAYPDHTFYEFHVYNYSYKNTIFNHLNNSTIPVREDTRNG